MGEAHRVRGEAGADQVVKGGEGHLSRGDGGPGITGQCEQSCTGWAWGGTHDSDIEARAGGCIESAVGKGPTSSVTLASCSPSLSLCPHPATRFPRGTLQSG